MSKRKKTDQKLSVVKPKQRAPDKDSVVNDFYELLGAFEDRELDGYVIYFWTADDKKEGFADGMMVQRGSWHPYHLPDMIKTALLRWM